MLDFDLDFLLELSFHLTLKIFFPPGAGENHLERLAECELLFQYLFASFTTGVISLLDLPDKSSDLTLGLGLPRLECSPNGCKFFLIGFQNLKRTLQPRPKPTRDNLSRLRNRAQFSASLFALRNRCRDPIFERAEVTFVP